MEKTMINRYFIFVLLVLSCVVKLSAQNCTINKEMFKVSDTSCCPGGKDENGDDAGMDQTKRDNLDKAIKQFVNTLNNLMQNSNQNCIPSKLWDLMKNRLCSGDSININCEKAKEIVVQGTIPDPKCKVFPKPVTLHKKRQGGAEGTNKISICSDTDTINDVDKIEETLFHEVIHLSENYYGQATFNNPNISTEDFSYTCTKQIYINLKCGTDTNNYIEIPCPDKNIAQSSGQLMSNCFECNKYTLPKK
jgi:hypothetical protein